VKVDIMVFGSIDQALKQGVSLWALLGLLAAFFCWETPALAKSSPEDLKPAEVPLWQPLNKWDANAEKEYSAFIEQLGTARANRVCHRLGSCLKNPKANYLWSQEDTELDVYSDCADLPYVLRAYFAYKTKRPFQWMRRISGKRYTRENRPKEYWNHTLATVSSFQRLLRILEFSVHSGHYRMGGELEGTDTYPIDITRKHVRPGTVYYDPRGHVLVVYKVEKNGSVKMMAGHPDNTLSHTALGEQFTIGRAHNGGGFRNWRWYQAEPAVAPEKGFLFASESNKEILERNGGVDAQVQYQKTYQVEDYSLKYHEWVRVKLSLNGLKLEPLEVFDEMVQTFCIDVNERVEAVQVALDADLHLKDHPGALPSNIYGTSGEWETYSTPSRDARLKASARALHEYVKETIEWAIHNDKRLIFDGNGKTLAATYQHHWEAHSLTPECRFVYKNSRNEDKLLTLDTVMDRLFDLSFDPYHCPEMRWGALPPNHPKDIPSMEEYRTCRRDSKKVWWYWAENQLRHQIEREYGVTTGLDFGPKERPDVHIPRLLESLVSRFAEVEAAGSPSQRVQYLEVDGGKCLAP